MTVRAILADLLEPLARVRPDHLIIDMAHVCHADCGATAVLLRAASMALPPPTRPVVRAPSREVNRLLQVAGWSQVCTIDLWPSAGNYPDLVSNRPGCLAETVACQLSWPDG